MNQIVWNDKYNIGVDFIDKEHKMLFSTMNKLLVLSQNEEKSEWVCQEGIKYLKNHTVEHFEHEEEFMRSINYSEYELHKRLHDNFRLETLPALEKEMAESKYSAESIRHFLGVCIGWVVAHTETEDQAMSGKSVSRWVDIPHEQEVDALEQTIIQLVKDMFRMKAKLISEQYAGEDFGKMICCHLTYRGQKKEKWQVTLIFEEQLILKIISKMLNTEYKKIDDMIINITRYISRQFLEQISERFPLVDFFEVEKESLLTHEQLLKFFERAHPSCSLLFNVESGYFAFCATASDSVRGKIAASINAKNAMDTIQEYLKQGAFEQDKQEEQRYKVLVVDDSEFMRNKMVELLEEDYEVIESDSCISAIKSMTLNKPDLIILDYEMPVCDGGQALEMIRSDKDTADIPVIFLTGRRDRETVHKVMKLNPEGYLLKTMSDEDIKKYINQFFGKRKN